MKHLKKFEDNYEGYSENPESDAEFALDHWKNQRDTEVDQHLEQVGQVVELLEAARDMLVKIDGKSGYNSESIDSLQKVIQDLTI